MPYESLSKGIILHGPPRVGKTYICNEMIKELDLFLIYPELTSGEFQNSLAGESEKMLMMIAERADILPWELCVLFIDEIDALAPNR